VPSVEEAASAPDLAWVAAEGPEAAASVEDSEMSDPDSGSADR
jgi:hypothetical protein